MSGDKWGRLWTTSHSRDQTQTCRESGDDLAGIDRFGISSKRIAEAQAMFLGRYSHNVDTKGRLAIPARFRDALGTEVIITRGIDRCLSLYPMEAWEPLAEKVSALSISDPDARTFRRMVFAEASYLDVDRQGRILLPADLRQYAHIDREATVVGVHSYIEIWSPDRWDTQSQVMDEEASSIAERLAEFI